MSGLQADAIKEVRRMILEAVPIEEVEGVPVSRTPVFDARIRETETIPSPFKVHTLDALLAYIIANRDGLEWADMMLHVVDAQTVRLVSKAFGYHRQRITWVEAHHKPRTIEFDLHMSPERMVVALQTSFERNAGDQWQAVLDLVSNLKDEASVSMTDDGMTQTTERRRGVARVENVIVPNPVVLTPRRTFREVEQPTSPFILRLKEGPTAALMEADGGAWKDEAIMAIAAYLVDAAPAELAVLA